MSGEVLAGSEPACGCPAAVDVGAGPMAAHPDEKTADPPPMRVERQGGERFDVNERGHFVPVDQPIRCGGEDTGPTPTALLIASLASCVAFYAHRYLVRHNLPTDGLPADATSAMGPNRPASR